MSNLSSSFIPHRLPAPADTIQARRGVDRWRDALATVGDSAQRRRADALCADERAAELLAAVFGNSPFLTLMAELEPVFLIDLLVAGPDAAMQRIRGDQAEARRIGIGGGDPATALRRGKRRLALTTAVADIASAW
ncbi:MAG TPA: hypothetical protein VES39_10000, partial [Rhodospirillales bacterium]|nr:hypothetical protein [Rhodospirillales bacterium]